MLPTSVLTSKDQSECPWSRPACIGIHYDLCRSIRDLHDDIDSDRRIDIDFDVGTLRRLKAIGSRIDLIHPDHWKRKIALAVRLYLLLHTCGCVLAAPRGCSGAPRQYRPSPSR